jgi:hypothetical protein
MAMDKASQAGWFQAEPCGTLGGEESSPLEDTRVCHPPSSIGLLQTIISHSVFLSSRDTLFHCLSVLEDRMTRYNLSAIPTSGGGTDSFIGYLWRTSPLQAVDAY